MTDQRPDPDKLLEKVQRDEAKARAGQLKIFFGACAGVGKTYAMLSEAHEVKAQGVDVVVGRGRDAQARRDTGLAGGPGSSPAPAGVLPRRHAARAGRGCRARPPARDAPGRRARAQQRARLSSPETLAGREGAAGGRDRRLHDGQRPARREPERRGGSDHRRARLGNRARQGVRRGRRDRAGRSAHRRPAAAAEGGQGLHARAGRAGGCELLPQGQPDCAARARAAAHRRPRRRPGARVPRGRRDLGRVAAQGAAAGRGRSWRACRAGGARRATARRQPARRMDRRLRGNPCACSGCPTRTARASCARCTWHRSWAPRPRRCPARTSPMPLPTTPGSATPARSCLGRSSVNPFLRPFAQTLFDTLGRRAPGVDLLVVGGEERQEQAASTRRGSARGLPRGAGAATSKRWQRWSWSR